MNVKALCLVVAVGSVSCTRSVEEPIPRGVDAGTSDVVDVDVDADAGIADVDGAFIGPTNVDAGETVVTAVDAGILSDAGSVTDGAPPVVDVVDGGAPVDVVDGGHPVDGGPPTDAGVIDSPTYSPLEAAIRAPLLVVYSEEFFKGKKQYLTRALRERLAGYDKRCAAAKAIMDDGGEMPKDYSYCEWDRVWCTNGEAYVRDIVVQNSNDSAASVMVITTYDVHIPIELRVEEGRWALDAVDCTYNEKRLAAEKAAKKAASRLR